MVLRSRIHGTSNETGNSQKYRSTSTLNIQRERETYLNVGGIFLKQPLIPYGHDSVFRDSFFKIGRSKPI
jgi:hypothetical protein